MKKDPHFTPESQDAFITDCGGIPQEPLLPPSEEVPFTDPTLAGNERIEEAIRLFHRDQTPALFTAICLAIRQRMAQDGHFIFPADLSEDEDGNQLFNFKTLDLEIGPVLVAFTGMEAYQKAPPAGAVSQFIDMMLESLIQTDDIQGLLLNPWGEAVFLGKDDIRLILTPGRERFI